MATRETRLQRGRRLGTQTLRRLINELRDERQLAGLSQRALANQLGISQAELSRLEQLGFSAAAPNTPSRATTAEFRRWPGRIKRPDRHLNGHTDQAVRELEWPRWESAQAAFAYS